MLSKHLMLINYAEHRLGNNLFCCAVCCEKLSFKDNIILNYIFSFWISH